MQHEAFQLSFIQAQNIKIYFTNSSYNRILDPYLAFTRVFVT